MTIINIPYVKKYDSKGLLTNPINKAYINTHPNRRERRAHLSNKSFRGNKKGNSLIVVDNGSGSAKYERVLQVIVDKATGLVKTIKHYIVK